MGLGFLGKDAVHMRITSQESGFASNRGDTHAEVEAK